ncbi:hypothetical protein DTO006G1_7648 [Penicillium roqueforti]|uniref:uncharacterized protein n=1 Tax=Penicillium roqueforti TaxID=5082 RepID=UPI00190BFEAF|nr:uncharacterized protein LCP9604111_7080 [Penicillium roqueforti]KAF9244688.1 hypothetical protein LCP9604111_7080 [Penicillium roqueforti]KAI1831292.1 hypothetical protein CBS147337_8050 [Penicillium roqueforti]KAI2681036.1 hypothetical protein LCP963914a_6987 [Penicillium roqueforti]KAI2689594.1 hypothetical protein CBS147355_45 [Penicillium roqueforti]KAI2711430.1 hypothetical protein CBS147318_8098 [Penicillium roqueforti]
MEATSSLPHPSVIENVQAHILRVSPAGPDGKGIISVVLNANGLSDEEMQKLTTNYGHPSGFVFSAPADSDLDYEIRVWHPDHELEKCAHVMIGTVWLLSKLGMMPRGDLRILTKSDCVEAKITKTTDKDNAKENIWVEFFNLACDMNTVNTENMDVILSDLKISRSDIAPGMVHNAGTVDDADTDIISTTLIPIRSVRRLRDLKLSDDLVKKLLERIQSPGLCLYAIVDEIRQEYEVRQVPEPDANWEDTTTALAFALLINGFVDRPVEPLQIREPCDNDRYREINLRFRLGGGNASGCWIGGTAEFETEEKETGQTKTDAE